MNTLAPDASTPGSPPGHARPALTCGPLVVVAGIPGAGKSTALEKLVEDLQAGGTFSHPIGLDPVILDSASVRRWLCSRLTRVPYPLLRPVVHTTHGARILALALTEPRPLLVHETATRQLSRLALRALARCGRRPAHLVWIDVPAEVALRGQIDRRRLIRPHNFARHLHRIAREHPVTAARRSWDAVYATDRDNAAAAIIAACTTC